MLIPIVFQKSYVTFTGLVYDNYQFPEFESPFLNYQPIQWIQRILVASKHACLVIIMLCYIDIIVFYRYCYTHPKMILSGPIPIVFLQFIVLLF